MPYLVCQGTELYTKLQLYAKVQSFTASCLLLCTARYKVSQPNCPLPCTPRYRVVHQGTEFHSQLSVTLYAKVQSCTPRYRVSQPAVRYFVRQGTKFHKTDPYLVHQGTEFRSQLSPSLYRKVQSCTPMYSCTPVSYTHLTLPTNHRV